MRVDRFLKLSRLVKRRTVAHEMAESGAIRVAGRKAEPSTDVKTGDEIEIAFPRRVVTASVITADEKEMKRGAKSVEITSERRVRDDEDPWI